MTALDRLVDEAHALGIALHTVEVVRGGELVVSAACDPLTVDSPLRTYSVSKTVTGLAVGILASEDGLDLDDPVLRHFPELAPAHPWVAETTVRDVLAMRGPHHATTFKGYDGGWVESYFRVPPTHRPGGVFTYDTSGSHLLAALVERRTGGSLTAYLRPRLLDPLGVSEDFRFLTDPDGVSQGGSGLVCTPRDLRRIAQVLHDDGVHGARRLVPAEFLRAATTPQADTSGQSWGAQLRGGYGYQVWLPRRGGWLMFGLGGQLVHGDPDRDLVVVVTADTQACTAGDQRLIDLVVGELADEWASPPRTGAGSPGGVVVEQRALGWPSPAHDPSLARPLAGRWTGTGTSSSAGLAARSIEAALDARGGELRIVADDGAAPCVLEVRCGEHVPTRVAGVVGPGPAPAVVTAGWSAPSTLEVRCDVLGDELATLRLSLVPHDDGTLTLRCQGDGEAVVGWDSVATYRPAGPAGGAVSP